MTAARGPPSEGTTPASASFVMDAKLPAAHIGPMTLADRQDIQATLAGDGEAFTRLVRRHQDRIAGYMWRFTRDRGELEELVQEVFVEAYFSLGGYRGRAPFSHWLMRIATRVGYRLWKRRRRHRPARTLPLEQWDALAAAEQPDPADCAELVHALLAELPPRDRLVLTLIYIEGLSAAQVAERTGWSRTLVKVQAHRARRKLKAALVRAGLAGRHHKES